MHLPGPPSTAEQAKSHINIPTTPRAATMTRIKKRAGRRSCCVTPRPSTGPGLRRDSGCAAPYGFALANGLVDAMPYHDPPEGDAASPAITCQQDRCAQRVADRPSQRVAPVSAQPHGRGRGAGHRALGIAEATPIRRCPAGTQPTQPPDPRWRSRFLVGASASKRRGVEPHRGLRLTLVEWVGVEPTTHGLRTRSSAH